MVKREYTWAKLDGKGLNVTIESRHIIDLGTQTSYLVSAANYDHKKLTRTSMKD